MTMRRLLPLLLLFACRTSEVGKCASDADCPAAGSRCDLARDPPVCVLTSPVGCSPACDAAHVCDAASSTCVPVTTAEVIVTSPTGGFASSPLQATATARAPGGVSAVSFELRRADLTVASAAGHTLPGGDGGTWTASLTLTNVTDGPAQLVAIAGALTSAKVSLVIDQHAPTIALTSDLRGTLFPGGATATVTASIDDNGGSGVDPASVKLLAGTASLAGSASGSGFSFAVPLDDALAPAGATTTVTYSLIAKDRAGNLATLAADPREVIRVDRDAPQITLVGIVTAPDYTTAAGRAIYAGSGPALTVSAKIQDGAGIGATCLRLAGETGACAHPGTAASGGVYSFSLPRDPKSDGTTPDTFTITADDALAASAPAAFQAEHRARSAAQSVYFDNAPPAVSISSDPQPYARVLPDGGTNLITVTATIADPSGLAGTPQLVASGVRYGPVDADGGFYTFQLDPSGAPAGAEGPYGFSIQASDNLRHAASVAGARFIDDAAPTALLEVFLGQEPGSGVGYPAAVANTGHTGNTFIYSDVVHVKGNLSDKGGLSRAIVHVDGTALDGGVSAGAPLALGCPAGVPSCDFDLQVPLNQAGNGAFHTGAGLANGPGNTLMPSGQLQFVLEADDRAAAGDGTSAVNTLVNGPLAARATRLLFQVALPAPVTGLAVHPAEEIIATTDGGPASDTVFALEPARPAIRWSFGADAGVAGLGAIDAPPAIDTGDAPQIFVASEGGTIQSLSPAGAPRWHADTGALLTTSPAVLGNGRVAVPAADSATLWSAASAGATSVTGGDVDGASSPLVLNGNVFLGNDSGLARFPIQPDGTPGAPALDTSRAGPFTSLATDGTRVIAANAGSVAAYSQSFSRAWTQSIAASSEPTIDLAGKLNLGDTSSNVLELDPLSGAPRTLFTLPAGKYARVPLQGSDGHTYYPRSMQRFLAYQGAQLSWQFASPVNIWRAATIDCAGRLYTAAGNTVYAFVTDDHGLADTAWPGYRRDARNTANAGAEKYGISSAAQPCKQ